MRIQFNPVLKRIGEIILFIPVAAGFLAAVANMNAAMIGRSTSSNRSTLSLARANFIVRGWQRVHAHCTTALLQFSKSDKGATVPLFALLTPALLLITGLAVDHIFAVSEKASLQAAADGASLAAAKELGLTSGNQNSTAITQAVAESYLASNMAYSLEKSYRATTNVIDQPGAPLQVEVTLTQRFTSHFGNLPGFGGKTLSATSIATVAGKPNICLLALEPAAAGAIDLNHQAKVIGQNCAVFSNSSHGIGMKSKNDAQLTATSICSAGGVQGGGKNFAPAPLTDCPQFEDPLASRPEPPVGGCIATNLIITDQTTTLSPGTYCGGILINGSSKVSLSEGTYVMKDGALIVDGTAEIDGVGTGFYFNGPKATFTFKTNSIINLQAPKSGPLAGLLFFGSRSQTCATYNILSDHAHQMLGTIYLPQGTLNIDANQPIADLSAYTAIVAKKVVAYSGPTVTLNTNYDATDVPVPDGIRGIGVPAVLTR